MARPTPVEPGRTTTPASLRRPLSVSAMRQSVSSSRLAAGRGTTSATSNTTTSVSSRSAAKRKREDVSAPPRNTRARIGRENAAPTTRRSGMTTTSTATRQSGPAVASTRSSASSTSDVASKPPAKPKRRMTEREVREKLTNTAAKLKEVRAELAEKDLAADQAQEVQEALQQRLNDVLASAEDKDATVKALHLKVEALTSEIATKASQIETLNAEIANLHLKIAELNNSLSASNQAVFRLQGDLAVAKVNLDSSETLCTQQASEISELKATVEKHIARITALEEGARADEQRRRLLHNQVQELKGNIRVYCRVRPSLHVESASTCSFPEGNDDTAIQILGKESSSVDGSSTSRRTHDFAFDRVFRPDHGQEVVWKEIEQLCTSALDGYKVTVFAYGQTGSGKTYTMEGPIEAHLTPENEGMIPRAISQLFRRIHEMKAKDWSYSCKVMFLEIYNEGIFDLLGTKIAASEHKIRHSADGSTEVSGISLVPVNDASDVYPLLDTAKNNRSVAKTQMNDRSSRSHSVFQLILEGKNEVSGQTTHGVLNLVDLAGSERLNRSAADADRLKETQYINKSLSSLADVISKLANQSKHVPYRNSKLTYLLQNCFGGDSKNLMFVCIGPEMEDSAESLCSLRFAQKVNACQIGTARRNVSVAL